MGGTGFEGGVGKVPYTATQKYTFKPTNVKPAPDKRIVFTEAEATVIKPAPDERIAFSEAEATAIKPAPDARLVFDPIVIKAGNAVDNAAKVEEKRKAVAENTGKIEGKNN